MASNVLHFMWVVKSTTPTAPYPDSIANNKVLNKLHDLSCDIKTYIDAHVSRHFYLQENSYS